MKNTPLILLIIFSLNGYAQQLFQKVDSIPVIKDGKILKMAWAGGLNSVNIQTIDLNGDGEDELVTYDRMADLPFIFQHTDEGFVARNDFRRILPDIDFHSWIMFADIDCDGDKDLFTNSSFGILIYENTTVNNGAIEWEELANPLLTTGFSGKINLVVSGDDVPVIEDVDGDGDVDILVFNFVLGGVIHYNKNMAVENGACDDFDFVVETRRWGGVEECDCFEYAFRDENCSNLGNGGRTTHEGGNSLMVIDNDHDGDMDLLIGHSTCRELLYFENIWNNDSTVFTDFELGFSGFPGTTELLYPASYLVDSNNDGTEELIITSNLATDDTHENNYGKSIIQYTNNPTNGSDHFELTKEGFLQEDMLDFGASSIPVSVDIDGDLDQDILVASTGYPIDGKFYASINLMVNTGTRFNPSFEVVDNNYLELAAQKLTHPRIAVADFDDNGMQDLFISAFDREQFSTSSFIYYGNSDNDYIFDSDDFKTVDLDLKQYDSPIFYDTDNDSDQDMILGRRDGSLKLYENTGAEQFTIKEEEFLDIGRDFSLTKLFLYPALSDIDADGSPDLITADMSDLKVYYDFLNYSGDNPDTLLYENAIVDENVKVEPQQVNSVTFVNLFGGSNPTMLTGGITGGLTIYNVSEDQGNGEQPFDLLVFPNPVEDDKLLNVLAPQGGSLNIFDVTGRKISENTSGSGVFKIDVRGLNSGVYILKFISFSGDISDQKFIKH